MAINDTMELAVIGTVGGQQHIHTIHFRDAAGASNPEQGVIDEWQANARTAYRAMFNTDDSPVQLLRCKQVCGSVPLRAPVEEAEITGSILGTAAYSGDRLPPWLARVVTERTALGGRSYRGRFFIGGLFEGSVSGDGFTVAYDVITQAYCTALARYLPGGAAVTVFPMVVHSRLLASQPGTQCQNSSTPVTGLQVRPRVATMKSRKAGSGL